MCVYPFMAHWPGWSHDYIYLKNTRLCYFLWNHNNIHWRDGYWFVQLPTYMYTQVFACFPQVSKIQDLQLSDHQLITKYTNLQLKIIKANICLNWHKTNHNLSFFNKTVAQISILESQLSFIIPSSLQNGLRSHLNILFGISMTYPSITLLTFSHSDLPTPLYCYFWF